MKQRAAAVAGTFYPAEVDELRGEVRRYLADAAAREPKAEAVAPKALIVPHAGTIYSGPIAASAFECLRGFAGAVTRVILLGPAHRVALRGIAAPSVTAFRTPLGAVALDTGCIRMLVEKGFVCIDDEAHRREHALEVELPFLQELLPRFDLVPLVVGVTDASVVAAVLAAVWGGSETLIVVSTDLSHYQTYEAARRLDARTVARIEAGAWRELAADQACGYYPLRGLLSEAERRGMSVRAVDVRNSGDTAGDKDRVVGYGAFVLR